MRLTASFFDRPTLKVAKALLGTRLMRRTDRGLVAGWIVEVEAYLWRGDPACHAHRGRTPRNAAMFYRPGTLYVYSIHAKYCMNVVTEAEGRGAAILIRAVEPLHGEEWMRQNRALEELGPDLTNGPGKLCEAFEIDRRLNGVNLTTDPAIWLESGEQPLPPSRIHCSGRIGIRVATEKLWRFFIDGNRYVSGRASDHRIPRQAILGPVAAPGPSLR
jgi:DNA-3-methyladenine glycosylase